MLPLSSLSWDTIGIAVGISLLIPSVLSVILIKRHRYEEVGWVIGLFLVILGLVTFFVIIPQTIIDEAILPEDYLWDVLLYQLVGIPIAREVALFSANIIRGKRSKALISTPVETAVNVFERSIGAAVGMVSGKEQSTEKVLWAFADLMSFMAGIPATQLGRRLKKGTQQWMEEDGTFTNVLFPKYKKKKESR